MEKITNQKAWFLVVPVFALVAFSAVIPLMTVVNYSVQDTFGNNKFFWNGIGWYQELLDPATEPHLASRAGHDIADGDQIAIDLKPARFDPRHVQEIGDETR